MFVLKYRIIQIGFGIRLELRRLPGSRVRSLILHKETGMSAGSFSRTAAGDRAHFGSLAGNAPINVKPAGGGRAWGGDLIVFVGPGVGHLTDLVVPGEGIFESFFAQRGDI